MSLRTSRDGSVSCRLIQQQAARNCVEPLAQLPASHMRVVMRLYCRPSAVTQPKIPTKQQVSFSCHPTQCLCRCATNTAAQKRLLTSAVLVEFQASGERLQSNLLYEALRRKLCIRPFFLPRIPFMRPIYLQRYCVLLVALLLSACGFVRTGYDQLDTITYWWMNRYLDFNDVQARQVKADIKTFHAWHRSTQLPAYADILAELQQMAKTEVSPAAACDIIAKARDRVDMLLLQTAPQVSALALSLEPANMKRLRKKILEEDNEWREKWLDISPEKLAEDRSDQWRDRSEFFYGRLNAAQKQAIAEAIARSSMDPKISWMLRQKRQEDILATLEKIRTSRPSPPIAEAEIRALIERSFDPEDSVGAAMRRNLVNEACVNAAVIHQLATPAQRKRAQEKLSGLEQDFRKLAAR